MDYYLVPLQRRDFDFFDRQRDMFSDFVHKFDDEWRQMELAESQAKFEEELERVRNELHQLETEDNPLAIDQPFVRDHEGNIKMILRFDCSAYNPDEIQVQTKDNKLKVHARHVEEAPGKKNLREFWREYELPENVDPKTLTSHLSMDGLLQIEAPVQVPHPVEPPKDILIPIERLDSSEEKEPEADAEGDEKKPDDK